MIDFPSPRRLLEYVAFFSIKMRTREGLAHIFMGYDAFSDQVFNLGVEHDCKPDTVLKSIYFLLDDPIFANYRNDGFTLVLEEFQELEDKITAILKPANGKVMYNKAFNNYLVNPVLSEMLKYMDRIK